MKILILLTTLMLSFYSQFAFAGTTFLCKEKVYGKYTVIVDQNQNSNAIFPYLIRLYDNKGKLIYNAPAEVSNSGPGVVLISGGADYPDGTQSPATLIFTINQTGKRVRYMLVESTYGQREFPMSYIELACKRNKLTN